MADNAEILAQWIVSNQDKAGSPEYVQKAEQYRALRTQQTAPPPDPNSAYNVGGRIVTGAVTGIPDTLIGIGNAMQRFRGEPEAPYVGPKMQSALGIAPLPENASTTRQLLEGGGSALLGGGAGMIRSAVANAPTALRAIGSGLGAFGRGTVAPTTLSHSGGAAGGYVAEKAGLDKETGALLGSLVGGVAPTMGPGAVQRYRHERYAGQARPDAPEIAAAAARQNIEPTAGMLGNADIQGRERTLSGRLGAKDYINNRRQGAIDQINTALDRITTARGATTGEPTPASIGQVTTETARAAADDLRARSNADQQRLADRIGADTPVPVQGVYEAGYGAMPHLSVPGRQAIDFRLTDQLSPLLNRDISGQPTINAAGSPTVPYEPFRHFRTDLGRSIDTGAGGRMPPTAQLYEPATAAMRTTAEAQGVPRQDFENIQGRTRAVEREGGDYQWLDTLANREPGAAFNFIEGGTRNPDRLGMLEATQRPEVPGIMGDYLRLLQQRTLGQGGARGPINFANEVSAPRMDPAALDVIAGPQAPAVRDVATAAEAINYPTSQTGLTRSLGPAADRTAGVITSSEIGGAIGSGVSNLTGIPYLSQAGRILGATAGIPSAYLKARGLEGPTAINALSGGEAPPVTSMSELVAALNAAQAAEQQRRGPVRVPITGGQVDYGLPR